MQLQPHLIVVEPLARQPRPAESILAFLDVLLSGAALIVELHHPIRLHRKVGHDETHAGEQLARRPLDLRDHPPFTFPALRLVIEGLVETLDFGLGGPPHGPG